jgi:DNA-binding CsgD family transcriptional regulator
MEDLSFYKQILDRIPAIVYVNQIDDLNDFTTSKNIYLSPLALNHLTFNREEIDKMGHEFFFKIMHPDDFKVGPDSINYLDMKEGDSYGGFQRILYKDGNYHWSYGYGAVLEWKDGKPWRFINCQIDLDNKMHTHEQFMELVKENSMLKNMLILQSLTKREKEIAGLIANGKTDKEISNELFISLKTAKTHRNNIIKKLNLKNTADLVRFAVENNLC